MMKKMLFLILCAMLASCVMQDVRQYQNKEPKLDLVKYFVGTTDAWGMFQKRNGDVIKRFHVEITGTQSHDALILDERFKYDDGTHQERIWTLILQSDGRWVGTAPDVKGESTGTVSGNALHWDYTLLLPVDGSTYEMKFDDWMYLIDEQSMLNRSSMSKFGVELGQVTLFFKKRGDDVHLYEQADTQLGRAAHLDYRRLQRDWSGAGASGTGRRRAGRDFGATY